MTNSGGISRREFLKRTGLGAAGLALPALLGQRRLFASSSVSPFGLAGEKVYLMENHNEALLAWFKEGVKDKVLIHLDTHGDIRYIRPREMKFVAEAKEAEDVLAHTLMPNEPYHPERFITIANFLYAAVGLGVVKEIIWVVPDAELVVRNIDAARSRLEGSLFTSARSFEYKEGRWQGYAYGSKITITPLDNLPSVSGPVLLDMDVDLFTFDSFVDPHHISVPRIWPPEVFDILLKKVPRPSVITICHSIQNGFTPLRFRYLGHWFEGLVRGEDGSKLEAWQWLKKGDLAFASGDAKRALETYEKGLSKVSDYAPLHFSKALALESLNNEKKAQEGFHEGSRLDPIYERHLFYRAQAQRVGGGSLKEAVALCRRFLEKNPQDIPALFELGIALFWLGKYGEAEREWKKVLAISPKGVDALGFLGAVSLERGEPDEALKYLETSLARAPGSLLSFFGRLQSAYKWRGEERTFLRLFSSQLVLVSGQYIYEEEARVDNLVSLMRRKVARGVNWQEAIETGLKKTLQALHPEATTLTQAEFDRYLRLCKGKLPGIGARLSYVPSSGVVFTTILPEGPADKAGISPGDRLLEINGRKTEDFSLVHLRLALSGEAERQARGAFGGQVKLLISKPDGKSRDVILEPRVLPGEGISYSREGQVGYMRVIELSPERRKDLIKTMNNLMAGKPDKLILDLRSGFGDMETAGLLGGLFLGQGRLMGFARDRPAAEDKVFHLEKDFYSSATSVRFKGRLAVLIDEKTEGPIELLAAALKIHGPGKVKLFGRETAGKNSITKEFRLFVFGKRSCLVFPAARLHSPDGTCLERVKPDVRIEGPWPRMPASPLPKPEDLQKEDEAIKAALSWLRVSP